MASVGHDGERLVIPGDDMRGEDALSNRARTIAPAVLADLGRLGGTRR